MRVEDQADGKWVVSVRGELHLAILLERMRREGYEFQVSKPQAIVKEIDGQTLAPFEKVFIEVPRARTTPSCRRWASARANWSK